MGIKPGYKQTEVGVIPEDWDVCTMNQVGRVIRGASPRPKGDRRFYGGMVPRLMVEDVTRDGKFVTPQIDFLTEEGAKQSRPCKRGTLTIVCSGTVGIPSFLAVDACIHDGFLALIDLHRSVFDDFLFYQLVSAKERFSITATHGGIFTNLTTEIFGEFKIPLPRKVAEQRAIAEALSDVDAQITALDSLIAKKREVKQATMQQLFTGKTRLPGFEEKLGYKQTILGAIPEDWEIKPIKEIANVITGGTPSRSISSYWNGDIPWVTTSEIDFGMIQETRELITDLGLQSSAASLLKPGTLLMAMYGQGKTRGKVAILGIKAATNQACAAISWINSIHTRYAFFNLASRYEEIRNLSNNGNQENLNLNIVNNIPILLPSHQEQQAIAEVLDCIDAEIVALKRKWEKTLTLKQGMMQELLTGKTRLI